MGVKQLDHVTVVVRDVDRAKAFFALLGFEEEISVVISGDQFSSYMGIPNLEAQHVTLVLRGAQPRFEIQLLQLIKPTPYRDPDVQRLDKLGYNHICFAVDDIEREIERLRKNGVALKNEVMDFHDRKLVFVAGPEGVTIELAQWRAHAEHPE
jgi:catechol 2,3-dioxygenase-like lactoylglutathione lyase family enzyme